MIIAIIVGCCTISVSAENSKILPDLQTVIEKSNPDDIVIVYIAFKGRKKQKIFAQVFDGLEVDIRSDAFGNAVIANVKVSDIETIAKYDIVQDIDYIIL